MDFGFNDTQAVACGLGILAATSFGLSTFVSLYGMVTGTFPSPEDYVWSRIPPFSAIIPSHDKCKFVRSGDKINDTVDRARHAHRNHTETAVLLICAYWIYALAAPDSTMGRCMILVSAISRVVYGPLYIGQQAPWRTLVHLVSHVTGLTVAWIGVQALFFE